ncbi:MAG: Tol-Pal system beta propeller repeat protein TolB [Gammaproteobacteria bacterium]
MKPDKLLVSLFMLVISITMPLSAQAFEIVIDKGIENALPIAVVSFAYSQADMPPVDVAGIIRQDLGRSGRFEAIDENGMPSKPTSFQQVNFADWRRIGMESLVIGSVNLQNNGTYDVSFRLIDIYRGAQITGYSITTRKEQLRYTAHQIADIIYEKLTGMRGAFATRIAYVTVDKSGDKRRHRLEIADADGYGSQVLLESPEPLMSPRWSADGRRIAYVSFEGKNSSIYIQDVYTGQRREVSKHTGINSAPAWSPDGKRLALTLSKDGNPEIYLLHIDNNLFQRVTNNPAIDTEPVWAPDGKSLYFTSDRGGSPQIYTTGIDGGNVERVTYEGKYNARASVSPDGTKLAMVRGGGGYRIAVKDMDTGNERILTDGQLDESPSFAPNGSMIIYATSTAGGGELAAVSVDGQVRQRLGVRRKAVQEPDWGPFQD